MIRKTIRFDFNNMFDRVIGRIDGVTEKELDSLAGDLSHALTHVTKICSDSQNRINLGLEWTKLPYQDKSLINSTQRLGNEIASRYDNVISLGIGGSYLGLKAAQDALKIPYYNEFKSSRGNRPRIFFDGNNLDPETLNALLNSLDPRKTFVVVISKSGETTETKAAFAVVEEWLRKGVGSRYGRQIFAITDPKGGTLRKRVVVEQAKDSLSFRSSGVMNGVGGRFSVLNIGLVHLAIMGVSIDKVLAGAADMDRRCKSKNISRNPAVMYAALHTILYRKKHKPIAILMPFSETLKATADWYIQLLAESLGKKYARKIISSGIRERWVADTERIMNVGRTPISARGTGDLHSIQQNNIEGENNKVTTFIKIDRFRSDVKIPGAGDFLSGERYSKLISLAEEATEWALVRQRRPNCAITMPELSPYHWGGLIFFFEMATAIEGELLKVNAFDQPGVEGYKNYMYYKLRKNGLAKEISDHIRSTPLKKLRRFII